MARFLMDAGFHPGPLGMHLRRTPHAMEEHPREPHAGETQ
jgi:hypothetical protein